MMASPIGTRVEILLPVVLSQDAQRGALVATGRMPYRVQPFKVVDFAQLDRATRERVVDVWDRIRVEATDGGEPDDGPWITRYEQMHYLHSSGWVLAGTSALMQVYFAGEGRTQSLLAQLRDELEDTRGLDTMLNSAPLLETVGDSGEIPLDGVLSAYENACQIGRQATDLAQKGGRVDEGLRPGISASDDLLVLRPRGDREDAITIALVRDSDPEAFDSAIELLGDLIHFGERELALRLADEACNNAFDGAPHFERDEDVVAGAIKPAVEKLRAERSQHREKAERDLAYSRDRERWIAEHGSTRLKRAASREYRHDGAYRDERLESEIPGFVGSLGKDVEIREVLNPSADALDAEAEVFDQVKAHKMADVGIRLVWVVAPFSSHGTGEYVQLSNYLGRHTVYRPVQPATDDDIPF
jgi:hypothetical protein